MKRHLPRLLAPARAVLSIAIGLIVAAAAMRLSGYNPLEAFGALWSGATGLSAGPPVGASQIAVGSGHLDCFQLAQTFATVTPLLLTGLAVALALKAGLFNIGAQGQMTCGALAAAVTGTWGHGRLPPIVHIPLVLLCGAGAGAAWGAVPGILKAKRGVHEVISTIMLNFVALDLINYLVSAPLRDRGSQNRQTIRIQHSAELASLVSHSSLTMGIVVSLFAALCVALLIARTSLGFRIRAVGLGPEAARASGVSVAWITVITMALSGAMAGIAGAIQVMGVQHRYVDGIAGTFGFDGIAVALLGGTGGGIILSALFFGALASGAGYMETITNVPSPIAVIIQAVVILCVGMRIRGKIGAVVPAGEVQEPAGAAL